MVGFEGTFFLTVHPRAAAAMTLVYRALVARF
jgi:hypothetical protein